MEKKDNSGAIFKNDRKEKESDPIYKGSATIAGIDYWVACWLNETKMGDKYMSMRYTPKQPAAAPAQSEVKPLEKEIIFEDLPF